MAIPMVITLAKKFLELFSKEAVLKEKVLFFLQNAVSIFRIRPVPITG
jgi:hypothetical protein